MTPTDVETVYDALAEQIDSVGSEKSELFLIKLALLISHELSDANIVIQLIMPNATLMQRSTPKINPDPSQHLSTTFAKPEAAHLSGLRAS